MTVKLISVKPGGVSCMVVVRKLMAVGATYTLSCRVVREADHRTASVLRMKICELPVCLWSS